MTRKIDIPGKYIPIARIAEEGMLPMGRDYIYANCVSGRFPHHRFGKRYFMTREQIQSIIDESERPVAA